MEVYKGEVREIMRRYTSGLMDYRQCFDALNASAADAIAHLNHAEVPEFLNAVKANEDAFKAASSERTG